HGPGPRSRISGGRFTEWAAPWPAGIEAAAPSCAERLGTLPEVAEVGVERREPRLRCAGRPRRGPRTPVRRKRPAFRGRQGTRTRGSELVGHQVVGRAEELLR